MSGTLAMLNDLYKEVIPVEGMVRAMFGSTEVACSRNVMECRVRGKPSSYFFPSEDVNIRLLRPTAHTTYCPYKGEAFYFTIKANGNYADNCAWIYPNADQEFAAIRNYFTFCNHLIDIQTCIQWNEDILPDPGDYY